MRYIAYGLAIFAAVLAIAFTTGNLPRDATASHNECQQQNCSHNRPRSGTSAAGREATRMRWSHCGVPRPTLAQELAPETRRRLIIGCAMSRTLSR
jgi:hypothetical protein